MGLLLQAQLAADAQMLCCLLENSLFVVSLRKREVDRHS